MTKKLSRRRLFSLIPRAIAGAALGMALVKTLPAKAFPKSVAVDPPLMDIEDFAEAGVVPGDLVYVVDRGRTYVVASAEGAIPHRPLKTWTYFRE